MGVEFQKEKEKKKKEKCGAVVALNEWLWLRWEEVYRKTKKKARVTGGKNRRQRWGSQHKELRVESASFRTISAPQ